MSTTKDITQEQLHQFMDWAGQMSSGAAPTPPPSEKSSPTARKASAADAFQRTTFTTDRSMEFFSAKELTMQIGHDPVLWPLALVKELIDNSLDACENAGVSPEITVAVTEDGVSVGDNGPGLPLTTLGHSLDYRVRVSDKSYYVSPTRGQLGNALKCVWAAPFVANEHHGRVDVVTGGTEHRIEVILDRIAQRPELKRTVHPNDVVKNGTLVRMHWPEVASYLFDTEGTDFYNACEFDLSNLHLRYLLFNPHLTMTIATEGGPPGTGAATNPEWKKWRPMQPTSPHWYTVEQFRSLITAYLAHDQSTNRRRTVRELVAEFDGLKGTAKQKSVTAAAGLSGALLADLITDGDVDLGSVERLLIAMQQEARPVKPAALGIIGKDHLFANLVHRHHVAPESIRYARTMGEADGLPFVLEVAFGVCREDVGVRELIAGVNWTPALFWPFRSLDYILTEARIDRFDPVVLVVHLACPRVGYHDRGKTTLDLPREIRWALRSRVESLTKGWSIAKKRADRTQRVRQKDLEKLRKATKSQELSYKEAAYQVMEAAYLKASGNGEDPADARQIMYCARGPLMELTGGKCWTNSSYFTQTLLPDFMSDPKNADLTADWDVVFDARGSLIEPHTEHRTPLGTVEVREYISEWTSGIDETLDIELTHRCDTVGPANRYQYALFVEKEGFDALLTRRRIAERFDIAIMSTKGMSVTAARNLVERLSDQGVTILVLHDFDKAGMGILHTLRTDTRRYQFRRPPRVVDLGLRLADAQAMSLQSEDVTYDSKVDPRVRLREYGATEEEANFLVSGGEPKRWHGRRIELNAMTSPQFIEYLERQLIAAGVTEKVVPDEETLASAWRRAWRRAIVQDAIDRVSQETEPTEIPVPEDIAAMVTAELEGTDRAWDDVLWNLVRDHRATQ